MLPGPNEYASPAALAADSRAGAPTESSAKGGASAAHGTGREARRAGNSSRNSSGPPRRSSAPRKGSDAGSQTGTEMPPATRRLTLQRYAVELAPPGAPGKADTAPPHLPVQFARGTRSGHIMVSAARGAVRQAGAREGDRLLEINGRRVDNSLGVEAVEAEIQAAFRRAGLARQSAHRNGNATAGGAATVKLVLGRAAPPPAGDTVPPPRSAPGSRPAAAPESRAVASRAPPVAAAPTPQHERTESLESSGTRRESGVFATQPMQPRKAQGGMTPADNAPVAAETAAGAVHSAPIARPGAGSARGARGRLGGPSRGRGAAGRGRSAGRAAAGGRAGGAQRGQPAARQREPAPLRREPSPVSSEHSSDAQMGEEVSDMM